jgi:hypothetical protein
MMILPSWVTACDHFSCFAVDQVAVPPAAASDHAISDLDSLCILSRALERGSAAGIPRERRAPGTACEKNECEQGGDTHAAR